MHMISSSLRKRPWRIYVLCAVGGCSRLEAQRRRTRGRRVSSEYWHSDGQRLCRPQTGSVASDGGRNDEVGEISNGQSKAERTRVALCHVYCCRGELRSSMRKGEWNKGVSAEEIMNKKNVMRGWWRPKKGRQNFSQKNFSGMSNSMSSSSSWMLLWPLSVSTFWSYRRRHWWMAAAMMTWSSLTHSILSRCFSSFRAMMHVLYTFSCSIPNRLWLTGFKSGEFGGHSWDGINSGLSFFLSLTVVENR